MIFRFGSKQSKMLEAQSFREFAEKYRASSMRPEESLEAFMIACAERGKFFNFDLDPTTPETFVESLLCEGIVHLQHQGSA